MVPVMVQEMRASARRTEPDTVRLRKGETHPFDGGRAAQAALLLLFCLLISLPAAAGRALTGEEDAVLEGSGIHYPEGFDLNTVGEVRGKASRFFSPERGPVRFQLITGKETYTVLSSPAWFWKDLRAEIPEGTEVRVRGSKSLGRDGVLYMIAQEIQNFSSGRSFVFREEGGYPLWRGSRTGPTGTRGGFGSPLRGGGGIRGGSGGMGRGRR